MGSIEVIEGIGQVSRTRFDEANQCWYAEASLNAMAKIAQENKRLRAALDKVANPITYLQKEAQAQGDVLNGGMAVALANDPHWLRSIASEALGK